MNAIKRKLVSRCGASMFLALMLFMMCSFAGGAALAAASGSANELLSGRAERQDYLTVASAARLLRDQLDSAAFTACYTMREYYYATGATDGDGNAVYALAWEFPNAPDYRACSVTGTALSGLLEGDCWSLFCYKLPGAGFKNRFDAQQDAGSLPLYHALTVNTDNSSLPEGFEGLDEVSVTWLLQSDFSLFITLSLPDGSCPMTLSVPPAAAQLSERRWTQSGPDSGYDDLYVEQSVSVTWPGSGAVISRGAQR